MKTRAVSLSVVTLATFFTAAFGSPDRNAKEWLLVDELVEKNGSVNICGQVANRAGFQADFYIEYKYYDPDGKLAGNASDEISGINDGETWHFECSTEVEKKSLISRYELLRLNYGRTTDSK